tara:strand:+ start:129 stop:362 length:234 start_codon:yes stop_codon:yes gene_type:complete
MTVKVTITTEARPWFNDRASEMGSEIEVTSAEADLIVERGWGEITGKSKKERGMIRGITRLITPTPSRMKHLSKNTK